VGDRLRSNASLDRVAVQAIGTFFGFLWVVGLAEEFFFRGLLQAWVAEWLGNQRLSLCLVSVAFGSVHLWFKPFPNWRFAIMAALAGVFYGLAFQKEKSVRASAVTHALTVTVWRLFVA